MNDEQLKFLQTSFSNKQHKLLKEIIPLVGLAAATALVSLQGVERASQAEINVIAHIISQFNPITVDFFQYSPRRISLKGQYPNNHTILITPQYKVDNRNANSPPWAIDLVIDLLILIANKTIKIATIGIEYDGHIAHYVESEVKRSYIRNAHILSVEGVPLIRISPESWKKEPEFFKKCIRKYLRHTLNIAQNVRSQTTIELQKISNNLRHSKQIDEALYDAVCPVCEGETFLGTDYCKACDGLGRLSGSAAKNIDLSDHQAFACPQLQRQ